MGKEKRIKKHPKKAVGKLVNINLEALTVNFLTVQSIFFFKFVLAALKNKLEV